MGGARRTDGKDEKCIKYPGQKNLKGRSHSYELGVDGKIILKRILGKQGVNLWTGYI